jgi:hypothetical protein
MNYHLKALVGSPDGGIMDTVVDMFWHSFSLNPSQQCPRYHHHQAGLELGRSDSDIFFLWATVSRSSIDIISAIKYMLQGLVAVLSNFCHNLGP